MALASKLDDVMEQIARLETTRPSPRTLDPAEARMMADHWDSVARFKEREIYSTDGIDEIVGNNHTGVFGKIKGYAANAVRHGLSYAGRAAEKVFSAVPASIRYAAIPVTLAGLLVVTGCNGKNTPTPSTTTEPTPTTIVTAAATRTPTPAPTGVYIPAPTELAPTPTGTPIPEPTPTPALTPKPSPTSEPTPVVTPEPLESRIHKTLLDRVPEIRQHDKRTIDAAVLQIRDDIYGNELDTAVVQIGDKTYNAWDYISEAIEFVLPGLKKADLSKYSDMDLRQILMPPELRFVRIKTGSSTSPDLAQLEIGIENVSYDSSLGKSPQEWLREEAMKDYKRKALLMLQDIIIT
jgi:outer membrane biosynthesis protein TonB